MLARTPGLDEEERREEEDEDVVDNRDNEQRNPKGWPGLLRRVARNILLTMGRGDDKADNDANSRGGSEGALAPQPYHGTTATAAR